MTKKALLSILASIALTACALSTPGPSQNSPSVVDPNPISAGSPLPQPADNRTTNLPLPPNTTEPSGRSASISLLPEASGTATPNIPPTLAPQSELLLTPREWYPLNATEESGDFSMTVLGWGVPNQEEIERPEPGFQFIWVDAVFLNRSSSFRQIYGYEVHLLEDSGKVYDPNNIYFHYEKLELATLNLGPGEHLRHEFYFTVPENPPALSFRYDNCPGGIESCGEYMTIPLIKGAAGGVVPPEIVAPDPVTHPLGEVLSLGDQTIGAFRWEILSPSQYQSDLDIPEGVNLVRVNVAVANLSQGKWLTDARGAIWVDLKDQTGRYFEPNPAWFNRDGSLEPGELAQGVYTFQVPPGAEGLELVIRQTKPGNRWPPIAYAFISLGDAPALVESVWGQMPGSLAPEAVPLGQAGQVGSFQMRVKRVDFPNTSSCSDIPAGQRAVLVTMTGENNTSSPAESYILAASLKDSAGKYYDACTNENDSLANGALPPGGTMTIRYSFIIPDVPGDLVVAQSDISSDIKVFFLLK